MKEKNILLTTLSSTGADRLAYRYFRFADKGKVNYCNSLSVAEAGTKYILSRERIDEIIVLGSGATYNEGDALKPLVLKNFADYTADGIENLSEYSFFRYRIAQFLENVDLEGQDVIESLPAKDQEKLIGVYQDVCAKAEEYAKGRRFHRDRVFHMLSEEDALQEALTAGMKKASEKETRWVKQYSYIDLDSRFKLQALPANDSMQMWFIPLSSRKSLSMQMESIWEIVHALEADGVEQINLYMDMQGIGSADGFTLISILSLLSRDASSRLKIRELITTHYNPNLFVSPIDNKEMHRYELERLIAGVSSFIQYGKVGTIREYWYSRGISNPHIDKVICGMQNVDDGISLCDLITLEKGIRILREAFSTPVETGSMAELESNIFSILERTIRSDYGKLLEGDTISSLELIKWAYRKHFYQQTLTIIESKVPEDIVRKGMLYYAKDEDTKRRMLESLQDDYMTLAPSQRWMLKNPDHYFVKNYGYGLVNRRQAPEGRMRDRAAQRIQELSEDRRDFVRAYSCIEDKKELLERLLYTYYRLGTLRNSINHAEDRVKDEKETDYTAENEQRKMLTDGIEAFIAAFEEALDAAAQNPVTPTLISGEEFKQFSIAHSYNRNHYHGRNDRRGGYHGGRYNDRNNRRGGFRGGRYGDSDRRGGFRGGSRNFRDDRRGGGRRITITIDID